MAKIAKNRQNTKNDSSKLARNCSFLNTLIFLFSFCHIKSFHTIMLRYHGSIAEYFNFSRMQNFSYFILSFTFFILLKFFHSPKMKQNITQFKSMDKCQNLLTSTSKQIRIKRNSRKKNLKCHRVLKSLSPS